ncbi:MAG: carotenoid oxygenase family protein, partial [Salinirussus sp.]
VDLVDYPDADVVKGLRLEGLADWLRDGVDGRLRRFRLPIDDEQRVSGEVLYVGLELPRITPRNRTRRHRWVYAQGSATADGNHLVRVDTETGETKTWSESGMFVEEPVPVGNPSENPGVVLVTALNVSEKRSDLLIFDQRSLQLRGRAALPHHLPFGFHGRYFAGWPSA